LPENEPWHVPELAAELVKDRHNLAAKKRLIGANQAHAREADRDGQQMDMSHHAMFQLTIQAGAGPGDFGKKDIIVQNRRFVAM